MEAKHIAKKLEDSNRIEHLARNPAFVTLKDHKENLNSKLPSLTLQKSELGKVRKQKLEKINKIMVQYLNVNQWENSKSEVK